MSKPNKGLTRGLSLREASKTQSLQPPALIWYLRALMPKPNEGLTRGLPLRETSDDASPNRQRRFTFKDLTNLYDRLHATPGQLHQTQA